MTHFLALDLGAESGRAMLGKLADATLALEEIHRFPNQPVSLRTGFYWDTLRLFHEITQGIGIARRDRHVELNGIGVDTWGVDFGLIGSDGSLVDNPHHYRDGRNAGIMENVFAIISRRQLFSETGVQFMQFNSLFQWYAMKANHAPALDVADTLLFMPDLFNYFLTGEKRAELTIASTSQFYNPVQKQFSDWVVRQLGLNPKMLPPLVDPGTKVGEYDGTPVYAVASHDTASAVAAVPARPGEDWAYISSGTWSLMGVEILEPVINDLAEELNFTNEIGVEGRVRLLKNIAGLWLWQECRRTWRAEGSDYTYDQMCEMAAAAKPFAAVIQPDAFLEPGDMPEKITAHCKSFGQEPPANHAEFCRVILESLALRYRQVLESLERLLGRRLTRIHIVGGGSRNHILNQFVADATQRVVVAGPAEATAAGNILVQAMGSGYVRNLEEIRQVVANSFEVTTIEPGSGDGWDAAYQRFLQLS